VKSLSTAENALIVCAFVTEEPSAAWTCEQRTHIHAHARTHSCTHADTPMCGGSGLDSATTGVALHEVPAKENLASFIISSVESAAVLPCSGVAAFSFRVMASVTRAYYVKAVLLC